MNYECFMEDVILVNFNIIFLWQIVWRIPGFKAFLFHILDQDDELWMFYGGGYSG
jgi:hypothetical protein